MISTTSVEILDETHLPITITFAGANFPLYGASIGISIQKRKIYAVMTFCSPQDKFSRADAAKTIAYRIASKKSRIVNRVCLEILPVAFFINEKFAAYVKLVFDRFAEAAELRNAEYEAAKDLGKHPLPNRAASIRKEFLKRVAKVKYASIKLTKKEPQPV